MSRPVHDAGPFDDPRIIQALEEYRAALDAGLRPDRRAFQAQHPEIATMLAGCLAALEFVHSAVPGLSQTSPPPQDQEGGESMTGTLGDFRILREIGRGGMGVVYEAEQISLGRRVALKVLPFASTLDPKQLQRFKSESQAAARLHHTNIVPVYATGCERSVHFYAMQFIDGQTLAAVIDDLRRQTAARAQAASFPPNPALIRPSTAVAFLSTKQSTKAPAFFRTVARLGSQAAEALEHAHQSGVVHRDIKPANLLADGNGHLWITDFGLARCQSQPGLTMSGDLLGTLRYMSPEQALGRRALVDHRTDIYSLGMTLYELLLLEPAFVSSDRQVLLRQIAFEDPLPPRRGNTAIPLELETIILKAIEKSPGDRYAAAQELADDLERFLKDEPIRARRPTWLQRAQKWEKRHRAAVATGAVSSIVLLGFAVAALTISNFRTIQEKNEKEKALEQSRASAAAATRRLKQALQAVDRMLTRVADGPIVAVPPMDAARKKLYEDALEFYQRLLQESTADPELRLETALAYARVGNIRNEFGQFAEATEAYVRGIALATDLLAEAPRDPRVRRALAWCRRGYSGCLQASDTDLEKTEKEVHASLDLWLGLAEQFPEDADHRLHVAFCRRQLAQCFSAKGRHVEAEQAIRQALATNQNLAAAPGDNLHWFLCEVVIDGRVLAECLQAQGRHDEAVNAARSALAQAEKLKAFFPHNPAARGLLAGTQSDLAGQLSTRGQKDEVRTLLARAAAGWRELMKDFPNTPGPIENLAEIEVELGRSLSDGKHFEEAEKYICQARDTYEQAVRIGQAKRRCRARVAYCWENLGRLRRRQERPQEEEQALHRAVAIYQQLFHESPTEKESRTSLANCHNNLAWFLAIRPDRQPQHAVQSLEHAQKAVALEPQHHDWWHTLGVAQYRMGHWKEALASIEKSRRLNDKHGSPSSFDRFFEAMACSRLGNHDKARRYYHEAVQWLEKNLPEHSDLRRLRVEAAELLQIHGEKTPSRLAR